MHAKGARPTGGKVAAERLSSSSSSSNQRSSTPAMSSSKRVAHSLNSWTREARDMLGGADGQALAELVADYMAMPDEEAEPLGSKRN